MSESALKYLYEAALLGSMRAAGDKLDVAVSSISRQVAQLERELGAQLIERGRKSIKLTAAGEIAYDYYRSALADRDAFLNRLRDLREIKSGYVSLAVGEGFLGDTFSSMLAAFQYANPGVELAVTVGATSDMLRMVLEDEVHIGLVFHSIDTPKIRVRGLALQPLAAICRPIHPLASKEAVSLQDLAEHHLCLPSKSFRIRQILAKAEAREHVWLRPDLTTNSLQIMRDMVKHNDAVIVLPPVFVMAEIEQGTMVARPLVAEDLEHTTASLIHRLGRHLDGAPSRLLAMLEAKVRDWSVATV